GNTLFVASVEFWDHFTFQKIVKRIGFGGIPRRIDAMLLAISQAHPSFGLYASAHQPSSSDRLIPPLTSTFIPLVPLASHGRRGVLIQTSTPWTRCSAK